MSRSAAAVLALMCAAGAARAWQGPPVHVPVLDRVDLIVSARYVVTMDSQRRVIENGAVAALGHEIIAVGTRKEIEAKYSAREQIDAGDALVMPGLINGHTHAAMALFRGLKDDVTLQDWLQNYIFPAEAKNVTEEFVTWGTRLGVLEMLRGGITTYVDMYYFEDAVARETKAAGMRGVLGETLIDFPAPDNKTAADAIAYTDKFLSKWHDDPLITTAVAPHSIYTCSQKTLQDGATLARNYSAPILIHVSETKKEVEDSRAAHGGESPVAYLEKIGLLGADVVAAHCVWVDAGDIALLAKERAGCVNNPSSNMMLASGVAPVEQMLTGGVALGLGTDGPAGSNNDLDMFEEMDLAAKLQKISRMDPRALTAEQAVEMATIDGARAIHMESEIGSLEAGKQADFIVVRLDAPHAVPLYDVYSQIVYALKESDVVDTVVAGRILMRDRKMLTLDEPGIVAKAQEIGARVKQSLAAPKQ